MSRLQPDSSHDGQQALQADNPATERHAVAQVRRVAMYRVHGLKVRRLLSPVNPLPDPTSTQL